MAYKWLPALRYCSSKPYSEYAPLFESLRYMYDHHGIFCKGANFSTIKLKYSKSAFGNTNGLGSYKRNNFIKNTYLII